MKLMSDNLDYEFEQKEETVNNAIRICVNCGNIGVKIDSCDIYCKDCNSKFPRKEAPARS